MEVHITHLPNKNCKIVKDWIKQMKFGPFIQNFKNLSLVMTIDEQDSRGGNKGNQTNLPHDKNKIHALGFVREES